ncbi:thiamine/thiamine pyrophosphate ABC transporter permease ThiP [Thioclava sp. DLFJ5-1]|uniref:thiamine/thiamine pyrophosphate ABC transporter permease ThiP n=1 Tax=Thioclava sp. DLFJ5-1 TaxID=1915314 RepID=UPI000996A93F|nr:thiamine/thiamine pyrophosphate ABC transporter permease ThiP [Thioclava sp. DLFJ5-1]OOY18573.1 thiamine/thiamine pyrophosphate ABC transporter permease ThiP [Thioclava sp. DLFJ5-1]
MATRLLQIKRAPLWAVLAGAALAALVLGTLAAVSLRAGGLTGLRETDLAAIRFTLWQAAASALISCALAVPVARALHRRRFAGRGLLISLLGAPFILPVIVAVFGLIAVFGRRGLVNAALAPFGIDPISIYGAQGVIIAHVFFNLPLATRMILHGWEAIPTERFRLAATLGFGPAEVTRHLERPMLRSVLPGAFLAIFLVCLTSFAVALTLGGGPRATTVELAIYQAFRFDFDMGRAASLALVQVAISVAALLIAARATLPSSFGAGHDRRATPIPQLSGGAERVAFDTLAILLAAVFLLLPIGAVFARGLPALAELPEMIWPATLTSLVIALASTVITLAIALPLALVATRQRWAEIAAMLPMTASSLVMGTGAFLIARPFVNPTDLALPMVLLTNAALSVPFATRILMPEIRTLQADYDRLAASLGLRGFARLRLLTLPRLARPLGFSAGLAAAFSMGDLGVITLFSDGQTRTLPLALFQLMGSYRMDQAAGAASLLLILTFALFWALDRAGYYADPR